MQFEGVVEEKIPTEGQQEKEKQENFRCSKCWNINSGNFCGLCGERFSENDKYTQTVEDALNRGVNIILGGEEITDENIDALNINLTIGGEKVTAEQLKKGKDISGNPADWPAQLRFLERSRILKETFGSTFSKASQTKIAKLKEMLGEEKSREILNLAEEDATRYATNIMHHLAKGNI